MVSVMDRGEFVDLEEVSMVSSKRHYVGRRDLVIFFDNVDLSKMKLIHVARCRRLEKIIIALFVDDELIAATSDDEAKQFIDELKPEVKITFKETSYFFGFKIDKRLDGSIIIKQASYTRKLLERFGKSECHS